MRLIVTRPQPAADKTAKRLRQMGHEVEVSPVLEIVDTGIDMPAGGFDGLVVTSANALRIIDRPGIIEVIRNMPVFCVGDTTALAAEKIGFSTVYSAAGTARELADLVKHWLHSQGGMEKRILYACGEKRSESLEQILHQITTNLTIWPLYKANLVEQLTNNARRWLTDDSPIGVLLYSARSAQQFCQLAGLETIVQNIENIMLYVISDKAKYQLPTEVKHRCKVAQSPTEDSLFQMVVDL